MSVIERQPVAAAAIFSCFSLEYLSFFCMLKAQSHSTFIKWKENYQPKTVIIIITINKEHIFSSSAIL